MMKPTVCVDKAAIETQMRTLACNYVTRTFGSEYTISTASHKDDVWSFLIRYQNPTLDKVCFVGHVEVNAKTALIMPLATEQIQEIRECAAWETARNRGELARNDEGYISRHQARRLARRWLDQHLSMKFGASGGLLIPLNPPLWQFSIYFALQNTHLEPLGVIDVDAQTGDVKPLTNKQLQNLRERVNAVIEHRTSQTACEFITAPLPTSPPHAYAY